MLRFISTLLFMFLTLIPAGFSDAAPTSAEPNEVWADPYQLHFLPFAEVAQLERVQRTKYIHALRSLIVELDKSQTAFANSLSDESAALEKKNQFKEFFAFIMGESASAEGERGRDPEGDHCFSAYSVSGYPKGTKGKRQPFLCKILAKCKDENGKSGVRCDKFSGIPATDPQSCITIDTWKSTAQCEARRVDLAGRPENIEKSNKALARAAALFDFSNKPPDQKKKLTLADLQGDEAKAIFHDLTETAYTDASFAERTMIIALYKQNGIKLPVTGLEDQYGAIDPTKFENEFNAGQNAIKQIAASYIAHCEAKISDKEIAALKDPKWRDHVNKKITGGAQALEKQRFEALDKLESGVTPTFENVLEVDECKAAKVRIAAGVAAITPITTTGPLPPQPGPPPPKTDFVSTTPVGCSNNVATNENHLSHAAARCMVCMAERAKNRAGDTSYTASTKWFSFLSTMALACGDGVADDSEVMADVMGCYTMAFGHCSQNTYAWDPTGQQALASLNSGGGSDLSNPPITLEQLNKCDTFLIENWARKGLWAQQDEDNKAKYFADYDSHGCGNIARREQKRVNKDKKTVADMNKDFARIYGISYDLATKLFCDPSRVKKTFWTRRVKSVDYSSPTASCSPDWIAAARARFEKVLPTLGVESNRGPDGRTGHFGNPLLACFKESNNNARQLYSPGSNYCFSSGKMGTGFNANAYNRMIEQVGKGAPAIVYDAGSCSISKQSVETIHVDPQTGTSSVVSKAAVFVDPYRAAGATGTVEQKWAYTCDPTANYPSISLDQKHGTPSGFDPGVSRALAYTYEDPSACTPSNATGAVGKGHGEVK